MKFNRPLVQAKLIKRYKRFLADAELLDGSQITAHVANPGSMLGMNSPGMTIWLEPNNDPKRKLNYSWKLAELDDGTLINVDTSLPNKIVAEALAQHKIPELTYTEVLPEVKYADHARVDFLLKSPARADCYLEIKSVTMARRGAIAEFPDSVTQRGAKHMHSLAQMCAEGHSAVVLYLIGRSDVKGVRVAGDIDPNYADAFAQARTAGVEVLCYDTIITQQGIHLGQRQPLASDSDLV